MATQLLQEEMFFNYYEKTCDHVITESRDVIDGGISAIPTTFARLVAASLVEMEINTF